MHWLSWMVPVFTCQPMHSPRSKREGRLSPTNQKKEVCSGRQYHTTGGNITLQEATSHCKRRPHATRGDITLPEATSRLLSKNIPAAQARHCRIVCAACSSQKLVRKIDLKELAKRVAKVRMGYPHVDDCWIPAQHEFYDFTNFCVCCVMVPTSQRKHTCLRYEFTSVPLH